MAVTACTDVVVRYVWATWDRTPILTRAVRDGVYAAIAAAASSVKCTVLRVGGIEDHVHVLVRLYPTVSVSEVAKRMKGGSSHFATHDLSRDSFVKWPGTYGAFRVGAEDMGPAMAYIDNQAVHHASGRARADWERCMVEDANR